MEINEQKKQEILQKLIANRQAFEQQEKQRQRETVFEFQEYVENRTSSSKKNIPFFRKKRFIFSLSMILLFVVIFLAFIMMLEMKNDEIKQKDILLIHMEEKISFFNLKIDSLSKEINFLISEAKETGKNYDLLVELKEDLEQQNKIFQDQTPFQMSQNQKVAYYEKKIAAYQELLIRKDELINQYDSYYSKK